MMDLGGNQNDGIFLRFGYSFDSLLEHLSHSTERLRMESPVYLIIVLMPLLITCTNAHISPGFAYTNPSLQCIEKVATNY